MTAQTHKRLPSEPTQEMIEAMELAASRMYDADVASALGGCEQLDDETKQYVGRDYPATVGMYRAMWQAAPEVEPVQTLEELEQEIYENTQAFIPHNVMQWMLKRYRNHAPEVEQEPVACYSAV
jgi:hypothetical protein